MKKVSIEYCHVTPGVVNSCTGFDTRREIIEINKWIPRLVKMLEGFEVQKCVMIDDIHATSPVNKKFIDFLLKKLVVKPDTICLESEFMREAHEMIKKIDPEERDFIHSSERTFLRENVEKYRSNTEFLLYWKKKNDEVEFSCPTLAATSYLFRLGFVKGDGAKPIWGEKIKVCDRVVNLLNSYYLQVEDKAQSIVEATFGQRALRKISWFFY